MPFLHLRSSGAKKLLGIVGLAKRPNEKPMERPKPFWVTSDSNERKQAQVQILRSNTRLTVPADGEVQIETIKAIVAKKGGCFGKQAKTNLGTEHEDSVTK